MYRAKTICRKLLFNQQFYFKHLFVLMLVGSSIAAFAGLYGRNGANLSEFTHTKALFDKNDKNNKTALSIADTIVDLKATGITAKGVTLSWSKLATTEKYTVAIYKSGVKVKTIITSSTTTNVAGLEAGTTYKWGVTLSSNGSRSATASFATNAGTAEVEGEGPIGSVVIVGDDPPGGGGGSGCTKKYWVIDADNDGYFNGDIYYQCTQPAGYVEQGNKTEGDCDDANPAVNVSNTWVLDADGDEYYINAPVTACTSPGAGYVVKINQVAGDCNDGNRNINPATVWYKDYDKDGYTDGVTYVGCNRPVVAIDDQGNPEPAKLITELQGGPGIKYDCDDTNPNISPAPGKGCVLNCPTGTILYVKGDATGSNDGSSWTNAFTNLQDALLQACPTITQIWVAKGTYYPDQGVGKTNNDRNAAFAMKNGLAIYGGFAGTETSLSQRNWKTNVTTLSGDIDQNDAPAFTNNSGNSYHVVFNNGFTTSIDFIDPVTLATSSITTTTYQLDNSAIIDGFTVKAGNANGSTDLTKNGGAMFNKSSSPTIRNTSFVDNATATNGGAVSNQDKAEPTFNNCVFLQNKAIGNGGGMYNFASDVAVTNCSFLRNTAGAGGGIANETTTRLTLVNSVFSNNTAVSGGGIFNNDNGIYPGRLIKTTTILTNCSFALNTPIDITNNGAEFTATNSIILSGDGINSNPDEGQVMVEPGIINVTYSIINNKTTGTGNFFANPLFIDAANDNLRLQPGSPAINSGNSAANNEQFDLDGFARKVGIIDIGAYEAGAVSCPQNIIYVNRNASGLNNGSSWANAYSNLQDALANQCPGITQIWVAKGTYYPDAGGGKTNNDRNASFAMKNGIAIYGGFAGTETNLNERNSSINQTILSGDIDQNDDEVITVADLLTNASRSTNSYHVVQNNFSSGANLITALLDGFIISDGNANGTAYPFNAGGGLLNEYASPAIINCTFLMNSATSSGGGLYNNNSAPRIINSVFAKNSSGNIGGGVGNFAALSIPVITNCTFHGNEAYTGGGIGNAFATPVVTNCIIWGNSAIGGVPSISDQSAAGTVTYSIVQFFNGEYPGTGNLNVDPLFVNTTNGDLQLKVGSPGINTGNDAANNEPLDLVGNARKVGVIDMGAYEYTNQNQCSPISVTSTTLPALQIEGCGTASVASTSFAYSTTAIALTTAQYQTLNLPISEGSCPISTVTYIDAINQSLSAPGKWVVNRTFTITDSNGATATVTQQITVEDKTAPTVITKNITAQINAGGIAVITPADINNGSSDVCGIASYSLSQTDFYCNHIGANTVTLTVTDVNGNSASATAIVTVEDKSLPTVITKNITVQLDANGNASISDNDIDAGSFDACGLVLYKTDKTTFNCSNVGANTVILTVTDANGNKANKTAIVTVEDKVVPTVITKNITAQINTGGIAVITAADINNSSSDACGIASYSLSQTDFYCNHIGANTVTLTVTDVNGNSASTTAVVTVEDKSLPTVITKNMSVQLDANGNATITNNDVDAGSFDACGLVLYKTDITTFNCSNVGANTVTLTVTDANGNKASGTATVTVLSFNNIYYIDSDGDGFGDPQKSTSVCAGPAPLGYVANNTDCDDSRSAINPNTVWYEDRDNDGYPSSRSTTGCQRPRFYYGGLFSLTYTNGKLSSELAGSTLDCDDTNASISPGTVWYKDADNDGFSDGTSQQTCYQPSGYKRQGTVTPGGDCNDADDAINPNTKWYPDFDNDRYSTGNYIVQCTRPNNHKLQRELLALVGDCNDDNASFNPNTAWYKDADDDGYTDGTSTRQCVRPSGHKLPSELTNTFQLDCNDANAAINPVTKWYKDADNDEYSDGTIKTQCIQPAGYKLATALKAISGDCDDTNPVLNPATVWYKDADDDAYSSGDVLVQCTKPNLYKLATELSSTFGDCSDLNPSVNPGAAEICRNGIDDNCNGVTDEAVCVPCRNATGLVTTNITSSSATFVWSAVANPDQWQIQYKTTNKGSKWVDVFVTGNKRSVTISSLSANQNYTWQIRAKCGKSWTDYSTAVAFKTTGIVSTVEARTYEIVEAPTFEVTTSPNPSDSYFTLTVKSSNTTDRILVRVIDELGRVVDQKENVMQGTTVRFGEKFIPGIYFVFVQQGNNSKSVKLIRR